ncbi:hypothetical protein RYO59_002325 [Thermosynechococcaceae cyanobacterium Okahandja]
MVHLYCGGDRLLPPKAMPINVLTNISSISSLVATGTQGEHPPPPQYRNL